MTPPALATSFAGPGSAQAIVGSQVTPLVVEALSRWQTASVDPAAFGRVDVRVTDLGGTTVGLAAGNTIWLDDNAAGWGWFVDATPGDDGEFVVRGNQGERNRMDLLTVVMHELGHLLGHDHDAEGVMAETLAARVRQTGLEHNDVSLADQVFRQGGDHRADVWLGAWLSEELDLMNGRARRRW